MELTRNDFQQMLDTGLGHIRELQIEHWKLFDEKLNRMGDAIDVVDLKVTKTNGSVLRHEKQISGLEKDLEHTAKNCPFADIIDNLHHASIEIKAEKNINNKLRGRLKTVITIFLSFVGTLVSVFAFLKFYNP